MPLTKRNLKAYDKKKQTVPTLDYSAYLLRDTKHKYLQTQAVVIVLLEQHREEIEAKSYRRFTRDLSRGVASISIGEEWGKHYNSMKETIASMKADGLEGDHLGRFVHTRLRQYIADDKLWHWLITVLTRHAVHILGEYRMLGGHFKAKIRSKEHVDTQYAGLGLKCEEKRSLTRILGNRMRWVRRMFQASVLKLEGSQKT